jgi:hypothetical protein
MTLLLTLLLNKKLKIYFYIVLKSLLFSLIAVPAGAAELVLRDESITLVNPDGFKTNLYQYNLISEPSSKGCSNSYIVGIGSKYRSKKEELVIFSNQCAQDRVKQWTLNLLPSVGDSELVLNKAVLKECFLYVEIEVTSSNPFTAHYRFKVPKGVFDREYDLKLGPIPETLEVQCEASKLLF